MQYLGGKSKIRKQIAAFLESVRKPGQIYFEPFVGGAWVLQEMSGERVASDGNPALIAMYRALQKGWVPPEFVSEEEYRRYKSMPMSDDPTQAFVMIGCSFGGKWGGGYGRGKMSAAASRRTVLKQLPLIKEAFFECRPFQVWSPNDLLIYADPPYQGTTTYGAFDGFDHSLFWVTMSRWAKDNTVVVSEYVAPIDWRCVREFRSHTEMRGSAGRIPRVERLFMHESRVELGVDSPHADSVH